MILDFRKDRVVFREIFIITEIARRVENYKYLGITIDDQLGKLM